MGSTGRSGSRKKRGGGGRDGRGAGEGARSGRGEGVEQREQWEDPFVTQPDKENGLSQTN